MDIQLQTYPVVFAIAAAWLCAASAQAQAPVAPTLVVRAAQDRHRISPHIYGINNYESDPALFDAASVSVQRWGGNATSRYNWLVDASNAGADFFLWAAAARNRALSSPARPSTT